ncbi:MAG: type II toxin-antitoxin system RelE/ParE family toxin [Leptospiraceae bacterium]|nr:type II toxin-antitoxin system RelE/ParE family toxin [Leptospiraceae bacterium]
MIKSFADKDSEKIWNRNFSKKFPANLQGLIYRKLLLIDAAKDVKDLKSPPGYKLHLLTGDRKNQYAISVNNQWKICFYFQNGDAYSVEVVDYH